MLTANAAFVKNGIPFCIFIYIVSVYRHRQQEKPLLQVAVYRKDRHNACGLKPRKRLITYYLHVHCAPVQTRLLVVYFGNFRSRVGHAIKFVKHE